MWDIVSPKEVNETVFWQATQEHRAQIVVDGTAEAVLPEGPTSRGHGSDFSELCRGASRRHPARKGVFSSLQNKDIFQTLNGLIRLPSLFLHSSFPLIFDPSTPTRGFI
jgi:hypothetical protein